MRKLILYSCIALLALLLTVPASARTRRSRTQRTPKPAPTVQKPVVKPLLSPTHQRMVFLGDSITDGNTYPAWVKQALTTAGYAAPVMINAGIGGNTALDMLARLERDVIALKPTLVAVNAGVNDAHHGVSAENYETTLRAIAERLRAENIPVLLITPTLVGDNTDILLANDYNQVMHRIAEQYGYPLADAHKLMQDAQAAGTTLLCADKIHPNFAGQRLIAQAVLAALGYTDVQVPEQFKPEVIPGLITTWQMRAVTDQNEPVLDTDSVQQVKPDKTWITYALPEKDAIAGEWEDSERQRGFAWSLAKLVGPGTRYIGVATIKASTDKDVVFNVGGSINTIWLNGARVYKVNENVVWPGWHVGKQRIPATLTRGVNTIIIEVPGPFALSVTDDN